MKPLSHKIVFDTKGNEKQKLAAKYWLDPEVTQILYGGAKYGAKSNTGCNLIFGDAMIYPNTRYFIARDSLTALRRDTIPSIYEVFGFWGLDPIKYMKYNGQDSYFQLYNGSRVDFLDASFKPSDPEFHGMGSKQYTRGWCEEIGDMHAEAIGILYLAVGRWKNKEYNLPKKLLMTCNPHKGYGYNHFYKPFKNGTLEIDEFGISTGKRFISALPSDNKAGDPKYIESLLNDPDKNRRERLAFGNWEYDDDPSALMSIDKIQDVFRNTHVEKGTGKITADIARLGGDRIVIIEWYGWYGIVRHYKKQTLDVTGRMIQSIKERMRIGNNDVLVDEDGLGGGVVDFMKYRGFVNNARPLPSPDAPYNDQGKRDPENFDNLKSQCYFRLAQRINKNEVFLECESEEVKQWIIEELEQVKQKSLDSDMKKGVVPKDKVKETLGRSPDFADAIMMREFFELKPKHSYADAEY